MPHPANTGYEVGYDGFISLFAHAPGRRELFPLFREWWGLELGDPDAEGFERRWSDGTPYEGRPLPDWTWDPPADSLMLHTPGGGVHDLNELYARVHADPEREERIYHRAMGIWR